MPPKNVQRLVADQDGLRQAYDQASLPESLFEAVSLAVRAIREMEAGTWKCSATSGRPRPREVMERMEELMMGYEVVGSEYLCALMSAHVMPPSPVMAKTQPA